MRILHVVSSDRFAGVERYISYVAPALAARGCDVTVVGGDPSIMGPLLDDDGVDFVPARNTIGALLQVARHRAVDVIHAHMTAAEWGLVPVRPFTHAAFVSTRHFAAVRGRPGFVRGACRLIPWFLDCQLAISAYVASALDEPTVVLANGVPVRAAAPVAHRRQEVLVLQRLEIEKDTRLALGAWARSGARAAGWRLRVAGRGSEEPRLRALASTLEIGQSVEFLGHVENVAALFARVGILLATAGSEPFGLSVVEAMAAGVPVVAAAGGAHLETVGSATRRYLFAPGDAAACAEHLDALVSSSAARESYGKQLQAHQREHFNLEVHVDRLLDIYRVLVAGRTRRA